MVLSRTGSNAAVLDGVGTRVGSLVGATLGGIGDGATEGMREGEMAGTRDGETAGVIDGAAGLGALQAARITSASKSREYFVARFVLLLTAPRYLLPSTHHRQC
jgi:hypothetical protein